MNLLLATNENKFKIICVVNCHIGTLNCSWCFTIWFWFDSGNSSTSQAGQDRQCIRFIYSTSRAYLNKQCGCHSVLSLLWFQMGEIFLNEFVDISTFWQTLLMRRFSWLMATLLLELLCQSSLDWQHGGQFLHLTYLLERFLQYFKDKGQCRKQVQKIMMWVRMQKH